MNKQIDTKSLFNQFKKQNILIIGDVMIDSYLWGDVSRISPEAPVPVVDVQRREERLGGAANVALNVQALGATPIICTVVGKDTKAKTFFSLLEDAKMSKEACIQSEERPTTTKFRIIGNCSQLLRVDEESTKNLSKKEETSLLAKVEKILKTKKIDAIIFQDYDKGVITKNVISTTVKLAKSKNIPVCVDPKKRNFSEYKNLHLFKPNLKELKEGLGTNLDSSNLDEVRKAMSFLQKKQNIDIIFVTLSEQGVIVLNKKKFTHIPAHIRQIADVSGAGDTVISVAALCLAAGLNPEKMAEISNLAGGLVCEYVGVVSINKVQLNQEIINKNCLSK